MTKYKPVHLYLTDSEHAALTQFAKRQKLKVSSLLRELVKNAMGEQFPNETKNHKDA